MDKVLKPCECWESPRSLGQESNPRSSPSLALPAEFYRSAKDDVEVIMIAIMIVVFEAKLSVTSIFAHKNVRFMLITESAGILQHAYIHPSSPCFRMTAPTDAESERGKMEDG
jgi:hypothetical protein